jgi:hypothetical protein
MPIFSARPLQNNSSALSNVKATVTPTPNAISSNGMVSYNVEVVGNMTDLVAAGVNNIAITSNAQASYTSPSSISELNSMLNNPLPVSPSNTAKVVSIDPKETVSHSVLSDLNTTGPSGGISNNIKQTRVVFAEVPFNDRLDRSSINIEHALAGRLNFGHGRHALVDTDVLMDRIQPSSPSLSTATYRPSIVKTITGTVPVQTTRTMTVTVPIGSIPNVSILDQSGLSLGRVGDTASSLLGPRIPPTQIKHKAFFSQAATTNRMINICFSKRNNSNIMHISSPYSKVITGYTVHVRQLSKTPKFDKYFVLGTFSASDARNITFPFDMQKKYMVHAIPMFHGEAICYSATETTDGESLDYDCSYLCYQKDSAAVEFKISNIPIDVKEIQAIRTNELTGQRLDLLKRYVKPGNQKLSTNRSSEASTMNYRDNIIPERNAVLSYDFFVSNKFGIKKHLFRKTMPIYEKDSLGITFKLARLSRNQNRDHVLSFVINYPDAFIPKNIDYSIDNPDDDFIEACRNSKRVCIMSVKRHTADGNTDDLGIHILNPGALNTLKSDINDTGDFVVKLPITQTFLNGYGVKALTNPNIGYTYEVRLGSYLLSNELSFLKHPIKLFVPNEFTDGKTAYAYDPLIYETPARRDRGLTGRIGSTRKHILEVALTSKSKILETDKEEFATPSKKSMTAKLVPLNNSQTEFAIKIDADLEGDFARRFDHAELLVSDSTTGEYVSLGKHRIITNKYYFLDTKSVKLACNKLKYKLVVRSIDFINVYDLVSNVVDIGLTNVRKISEPVPTVSSASSFQIQAFRGFR